MRFGNIIYFLILLYNDVCVSIIGFISLCVIILYVLKIGITMTDGDIWKVHKAFVLRHMKLLGLGQKRTDELIYKEYQCMAQRLFDTATDVVTLAPYLQEAAMNVLWELITSSKFDNSKLLMLMSKRSAAFNMVGGLLEQIPWLRYLAPVKTGYSLISNINQQIYSLITVRYYCTSCVVYLNSTLFMNA